MAENPDQPQPSVQPDEAGASARILPAGWAAKTDEVHVRKPIYRRQWFIRLALAALLVLVAAGIGGGLLLWRWHRTIQADLARQRRGVEAFVRSANFETFAREADTQLVAALSFATLRPATVKTLLPDIAAAEQARHLVPWALELPLQPAHTARHPARVRASARTATDLLAARGFPFNAEQHTTARRLFLRLLAPHARTFLAQNPSAAFPALPLDRRMQDIVLNAYAARAGGTREEVERAFVLYSLVGPALWREIDAQHRPPEPGK